MTIIHPRWRKEFGTDTLLGGFHFHERDAFISIYPQGYHMTDKMVCVRVRVCCQLRARRSATSSPPPREPPLQHAHTPQHARTCTTQEWERCVKYIMPSCSRVAGRHIDQTFAIIDVKGMIP